MKLNRLIGIAVVAMAVIVTIVSCNKESITTKPQIRFKKASSDYVPLNSGLSITLEFSDKEGDLRNNAIHVIKSSNSPCPDPSFADSITWAMPGIPGTKNTDGELEILFDANQHLARLRCDGTDTLETVIFKFVIIDDAGNISDTAYSPPIKIEK